MTAPDYVLRDARADDLEALLEVHEGAFRQLTETRFEWDPSFQRNLVGESLPGSQIIEVDGQTAGQLILEDQGDAVFLTRIMLHPRLQGRGLGGRVVQDVVSDAASRGLPVTLSVWENNRARGLYERLGFHVTAQVEFRVKMRIDPPGAA